MSLSRFLLCRELETSTTSTTIFSFLLPSILMMIGLSWKNCCDDSPLILGKYKGFVAQTWNKKSWITLNLFYGHLPSLTQAGRRYMMRMVAARTLLKVPSCIRLILENLSEWSAAGFKLACLPTANPKFATLPPGLRELGPIHRHNSLLLFFTKALTAKICGRKLNELFIQIVKMVNFIKSQAI